MTQTLADFIRDARHERNLTQKQLARQADISEAYVRKLEAGDHSNPGAQVVKRLAGALEVDAQSLLNAVADA